MKNLAHAVGARSALPAVHQWHERFHQKHGALCRWCCSPRGVAGGGMARRGPVESTGRFDVDFDVVLRARMPSLCAAGRGAQRQDFIQLWQWAQQGRAAGHGHRGGGGGGQGGERYVEARAERTARRRYRAVRAACVTSRQQQQHQQQLDGAVGQQAAGTATVVVAAAPTSVEAPAQATTRHVRWAPVLAALRKVEVPVAEVQAKQ